MEVPAVRDDNHDAIDHHNVRDGNAFRVPYAELRVQLAHGEVLISDEGATNGQVFVAGVPFAGTRFRLNADGTVEVLAR